MPFEGAQTSQPVRGAVVVDACVVMNLYATGRWAEIFAACGLAPVVALHAAREALWVLDEAGEREHVDLGRMGELAEVEVWSPAGTEVHELVELAADLGDGEAASLAIARARGLHLATDDRKARRAAVHAGLGSELWSTATLIRTWALRARPAERAVWHALQRVREGARYEPPADDDAHLWWRSTAARPTTRTSGS